MKTGPIVMMMVVSLLAGAFGGVVASEAFRQAPAEDTSGDEQAAATQQPASGVDTAALAALKASVEQHARLLENLAEVEPVDVSALERRVDQLQQELAEVRKQRQPAAPQASLSAASPEPDKPPAISPEDPAFQEAVNRAIEEREQRRDAERNAERQRRMTDMLAAAGGQILTALEEKIPLNDTQRARIKVVLDEHARRRGDVISRGMTARRNGEDFDWGTEMGTISNETTEAVRLELDASQQVAFDDLVGDEGIGALEQGMGRGMGFGRRPR